MIDNNAHQSNSSSFPDHQLLIFDDLLCDIVSRKDDIMQKLSTVCSNHKKLCVIILSQILFKPGDFERPRRFYKDYGLECENLLIWLSEQLTLDLPYRQYCNHNEFACWDGSCCLPLEKVYYNIRRSP